MAIPEVYADLSFAINFIMDFCILWATARLTGSQVVYKRIVFASFLGGIYALAYLIPGMEYWFSLFFKILFSCLMIIIALYPQNWAEFRKAFLYFYAINFIVAGASMAISYLLIDKQSGANLWYLWLPGGILTALAIGIFGQKYLLRQVLPALLRFDVELRFNNYHCQGKGFLDTGNNLRDPITNRPVIVAEYQFLKSCLPEDLREVLEIKQDENTMLDALGGCSWANRLRLIPFSSIGKKNGILLGVRADEIVVNNGSKDVFHQNMVVGIYREKLSSQGEYQFLIPAEIIENA
ncbi:sigma-E processing peptidase SpoIIGA [Syntrophomonas wolfei]|uniref:Sporulation sigma-E factor-processing peptidase n=1 Tax=Syntrophomonas wolfei subsp. wolfei (strain DSM 2245B / Goettingen) TaxID=335541 RepID=Q0AYQ0_SYNWW|nr:sigma-E processing peptidase SpoIIGA [Syntrophomonas wolfei]ABI68154.1 sporulation factor SpoIIGA. Unknown type peptidase. MEROPS family U04 [Syntrophomonas wolfei subsp. wolfei str. Goettingen G311]